MNNNFNLKVYNVLSLFLALPGFLVAGGAVWLGLGGVCGIGLRIVDRGG